MTVNPVMRHMQVYGHTAANTTVYVVQNWQEHVRHARWQACNHSAKDTSKGASEHLPGGVSASRYQRSISRSFSI